MVRGAHIIWSGGRAQGANPYLDNGVGWEKTEKNSRTDQELTTDSAGYAAIDSKVARYL